MKHLDEIRMIEEGLTLNKQSEVKKYTECTFFPKTKDELRKIIHNLIVDANNNSVPLSEVNFNVIDTSEITNMSQLFHLERSYLKKGTEIFSKLKIDEWNVSNVTDMSKMFQDCHNITADLSGWNVNKCENMERMFQDCWNFNSPIFQSVNGLVKANNMFKNCKIFNQDISRWNVSNLEEAEKMFEKCFDFNCDISSWRPKKLKNINFMFYKCTSFNQDLTPWKLSRNIAKIGAFLKCENLDVIPMWYKK